MSVVAPTTPDTIRALLAHLISAYEVDGIVAFSVGDKMQAYHIYQHDYLISLMDGSASCHFTCQHEYHVVRALPGSVPRHIATDRSRWELVVDGQTHTFFMQRREDLDNSDRVEPYEQTQGRLLAHHRSIENHQGEEL